MEILAWTAVIIIAIALEAATAQLVSIWFAGGGLAGLIAHFLHAPFWLQVIAAAVATLILLLATRPLVRRFLRGKETRTNADRVVGRTAVVTEPIDNVLAKGRVSVLGSDWTARSLDGGAIPAGAQVRVERIEGVKLIVSPENNT
ncbi:MAG: NfeD family protein [Acutalibacteraceae bacterium]|nr:NfeD family protein [Acutalibacteraceae bacterium]